MFDMLEKKKEEWVSPWSPYGTEYKSIQEHLTSLLYTLKKRKTSSIASD
jgi:hypothetical protein